MSYYDHAVMVHLKLGQWGEDPHGYRNHHRVTHHRRSPRRHGASSLLILVIAVLALGATGLSV